MRKIKKSNVSNSRSSKRIINDRYDYKNKLQHNNNIMIELFRLKIPFEDEKHEADDNKQRDKQYINS